MLGIWPWVSVIISYYVWLVLMTRLFRNDPYRWGWFS